MIPTPRKLLGLLHSALLIFSVVKSVTNVPGESFSEPTLTRPEARTADKIQARSPEPPETDLEIRPADFFVEEEELSIDGFTIQKLVRKERTDFSERRNGPRNVADIEYAVVKKGQRVLASFDAGFSHPLGSMANFGLFPFLGGGSQQVFISEDVPRGGCQWVVSLSPRFRVIFDGQALNVGREGADLNAVDIDGDGVYEIIAPITDFYQLHDKLYISAIPLPDIIFKYDSAKQKYLPANATFKNRVFEDLAQVPELDKEDSLNFEHRSVVLSNLLIRVYAGEQKQGWEAYEKDYKLEDKVEFKRRIKAILRGQPVYKSIYHRDRRRRIPRVPPLK